MNEDDFPNSDEEYDLVSTDVHQNTKHVGVTNNKTRDISQSSSIENQSQKPTFNESGRILISKPDDFPDLDEFDNFDVVETRLNSESKINNNAINSNTNNGTENSKKRHFNELLSDVQKLLGEDIPHGFTDYRDDRRDKRPRWDQPDLVIEAILNKKKENENKLDDDEVTPHIFHSTQTNKKEGAISLRVPPWNFVALTRSTDSQRLYIRVRPESKVEPIRIKSASGLLSLSYDKLRDEADKILLQKAEYESLANTNMERSINKTENVLWVDKYRPEKYMELLTDETVNRDFLRWLKSWDKVVFNREVKKHKVQPSKPQTFENKKFRFNINNKFGDKSSNIEFVDNRGLPVYKIALLTGPPGLGKTTLAHLVAKHAGYNVVEINASDDRNPEAFRQALLSSTQMKAMIGVNPRPNCLVLDEIDGAPAASIELLLKFIQGKLVPKGRKPKLGDKKNEECKRPIICICNELYSASLRSLRAAAYVINVPKVDAASLADRLMTVARREKIDVDQSSIIQLAERCGCDVRSCLNALQYMREDCQKSNINLGMKDTKKGLFQFWRDILQIPSDKRGPLSIRERVQLILKSTYSNNSERIVQGVFENYPNNCHDKMTKLCRSLHWFQFYDEVSTIVMTKNDWQVMPYTNYAFVSWHLGFALPKKPKLNFPYTSLEANQKLSKNFAIVTAAQRSYGRDVKVIILDIAPLLFELLTPKLRSVVSNLYSTKEKLDLDRAIDIMLNLGLSLLQEKKEDGSVDYEIEPNLYEIGIFPNCKARRGLSYTVKQVIAQELEIARLKRAAIAIGAASSTTEQKLEKTTNNIVSSQTTNLTLRPNHIDEMARIVVPDTSKEKKYKDFFKTFKVLKPTSDQSSSEKITSPQNKTNDESNKKLVLQNNVWYKYKEGHSNAVRRSLKMKDIL